MGQARKSASIKQSFTSLSVLALALLAGATQAADSKGPCGVPGLERCPQPFDKVLPTPKDMVTWDQATRVVGFRNTYRMYHGYAFRNHGTKPYPLTEASKKLKDVSYRIDGKSYNLAD